MGGDGGVRSEGNKKGAGSAAAGRARGRSRARREGGEGGAELRRRKLGLLAGVTGSSLPRPPACRARVPPRWASRVLLREASCVRKAAGMAAGAAGWEALRAAIVAAQAGEAARPARAAAARRIQAHARGWILRARLRRLTCVARAGGCWASAGAWGCRTQGPVDSAAQPARSSHPAVLERLPCPAAVPGHAHRPLPDT